VDGILELVNSRSSDTAKRGAFKLEESSLIVSFFFCVDILADATPSIAHDFSRSNEGDLRRL